MPGKIVHIALLVKDYDEAISFYTTKLGFSLVEDTPMENGKRWVLISPGDKEGTTILLARAVGPDQLSRIGNQTGGRVFLFLQTGDFNSDFQKLIENGVTIVREPKKEAYGTVAVFSDLYGNLWDLIQYKS
jgi:catechol 2,3-dioxygenase-like lactoylglutathione lyase family enzyme